jgi:hypothetical protein
LLEQTIEGIEDFGIVKSFAAEGEERFKPSSQLEDKVHQLEWVEIIEERSLNFRPRNDLQFALLDSELRIHVEEFRHFYEKLAADATVVFHDTGALPS